MTVTQQVTCYYDQLLGAEQQIRCGYMHRNSPDLHLFIQPASERTFVVVSKTVLLSYLLHGAESFELCHPRCVCENWKGYVVKHIYVN